MSLKFYITLTLLLLNTMIFAQELHTLTGQVSNSDRMPLVGVNILNNSAPKTQTNATGNYEIQVKSGDVLSFSHTGYINQSFIISDQKSLNIKLEKSIDPLIAIGYGTRKKSHNTSAIGQLNGKDITSIQTIRVDDALTGQLAGVLIQNQNGGLGAAPKIQIRAISSIFEPLNPLIIVDGYPISGDLSTINPKDVESIEILKDAASAAIYGSRGANGVILVTSKKGKSGKVRFNYDAYASTSSRYVKDNINPTAAEWASTVEDNVADGTFNISEVNPALYDYKLNALKQWFVKK